MRRYISLLLFIGLAFWSCEEDAEPEPDTTPPTVTITSPQNNTYVYEMVSITCISTDIEGIDKVELWVDGVSIEIIDESEPYSLEWNTTAYEDSTSHTITVRSYDTNGNMTDSSPVILIVDNSNSHPTPVHLYLVAYLDDSFSITWSMNNDDDFSHYELYEITPDSIMTLIKEIAEKTDTNHVVTNLYNSEYRNYMIETEDYWGLTSTSNAVLTYHGDCEPFVDLNGNNLYDADYCEEYVEIFGTLILLDFGLDRIPAEDANGDGDYDDDGDTPPDADGTEGNGVWDGETFEDLNENETWDCY